MKLEIERNYLHIKLNPLEIVLSHRSSLNIPLDLITHVSTEKPKLDWAQIRAPGTHIPFLLKAGTYHGRQSKEFWQMTIGRPYLVIDIMNWDYDRIVLTVGDNEVWTYRINQARRKTV